MEASDAPWLDERTFAIRLAHRVGWQLIVAPNEAEARRFAVGSGLDEVVEVLPTDMRTATRKPSTRRLSIADQDLRCWNGQSWAFDEAGDCWRGIDQPITAPPGAPVAVERLDVAFTLPRAGWVDMRVAAGLRSMTVPLSNLFDSFQDLVSWLEAVLDGGAPRYMISTESSFEDFHLFPAAGDCLRFAIAYVHFGESGPPTRQLTLDVLISRRSLLRSFAEPLHAYWRSPELKQGWTEWIFELNDPEKAPDVPERLRASDDAMLNRLVGALDLG